jgi:hypothetical protein
VPTVIDSLFVALGLDPTGYNRGLKAAAEQRDKFSKEEQEAARKRSETEAKQARTREEHNKRLVDGYHRIRNEMLGLLALFTAGRGIKDFVRDLTQGDAAAGRFAHTVNMSVEDLGAWEEAAKRVGGTAQGMDATIDALTQGFMQFTVHGLSEMDPYLRRLGLSFKQFTDQAGIFHPDQMLLAINKAFRGRPAQEQVLIGRALHLDQAAIQLMMEENLQGLIAQMRSQGTPTGLSALFSQKLLNAFYDVQQLTTDTVRQMLVQVTPDLIRLLQAFTSWMTSVGRPRAIETFGRVFTQVRDVLREFFTGDGWRKLKADIEAVWQAIETAVDKLGGWKTVAEIFLGLWAANQLAGPLLGIGMLAMAFSRLGTVLAGIAVPAGLSRLLGGAGGAGGGLGGLLPRLLGVGGAAAGGLLALLYQGARDHGKDPTEFIGRKELVPQTLGENVRRGLGRIFGGASLSPQARTEGEGLSRIWSSVFGDHHDEERRFTRMIDLLEKIDEDIKRGLSYAGGVPGQDTPRERIGAGQEDREHVSHPGAPSAEVRRRAQIVHDILIAKNWPEHVVAGIIANIQHENADFDPAAVGDHGSAYGLLQWHRDREAALARAGIKIRGGGIEDQALAIDWELRHEEAEAKAGRALLATHDAREAGSVASKKYVRPKLIEEQAQVRGEDAETWMQRWGAHAHTRPPPPRPVSAREAISPYQVANSNAVNINGPITIHTQATDAAGVSRDLYAELRRRGTMAQVATGLT